MSFKERDKFDLVNYSISDEFDSRNTKDVGIRLNINIFLISIN